MKLITTTGYYGTGSSAITDLLQEYSTVTSLGSSFECRIAHDMYGLSDLEYYLVDNYHRHNSSTALNNFKRLMGIYGLDKGIRLENYPEIFGENFEIAVQQYINALAPMSYKGGSHTDLYAMSDLKIKYIKIANRFFNKIHKSYFSVDDDSYKNHRKPPIDKSIENITSYISYPREYFYDVTREFTRNLFSTFITDDDKYIMVDQLIPPTNTQRYIKYFDDIKVICVDRDPRDIYYLEKYFWRGCIVPTEVNEFIAWYKATRSHKKFERDDHKKVLRINFENLVLDYERTVSKIERFLELNPESHINPRISFDPEISKNNIGKWKDDPKEKNNIQKIESELFGEYYE